MQTRRIHVTGASGSGVTTLGHALARELAIPHHDSDDYFWLPTVPPYRETRAAEERLRLMEALFLPRSDWVLSGSVVGWAESITATFDLVVFLTCPADIRLARLRDRETRRFGAEAVGPGGWRHEETESFLEWAAHYDDNSREGRNLARHETWLETTTCPLLRLDGTHSTAELLEHVVVALPERA